MGLIETEGLILKSYNLAEADRIVVFLTQQQGLVKGVAKGAKRLKSKFGGSLEPFSVVNLAYFQKEERELVSIRQIELVKSYFELASDPAVLQKFAYLAELLIEFSPPHDPNEKLYRMAKVCLEAVSKNPQTLEIITLYFELWLLRLGGYLPNWNRCDVCKKDIETEKAGLQINFHLICAKCQKAKSNVSITAKHREIYSRAQKLAPVDFIEFAADKSALIKDVSKILKRVISNILGREVLSEKVLMVSS